MARKVNTKFVVIIGLALVVLAGGAYGVYRWKKKDPKILIARGDALVIAGKFDDAGRHYEGAARILKDPSLFTKAGDQYNKLAYEDREYFSRALAMWGAAISIDAGYMPALTRMLALHQEELDLTPEGLAKSAQFEATRDYAERILRADPANKQAKAMLPVMVIRAWLSGIETDPAKLDQAMKDLAEQQKADPGNPDIPFFIASAQIRMADGKINTLGAPTGEALYADAVKTIDDALKGQDDNGDLHFRAAQIYFVIGHKLGEKEARDRFQKKYQTEIERAVAVEKPSDRFYAEATIRLAENFALENKLDEAEKISRKAMELNPSRDLVLRIRLATMLGGRADRRDDAIALLANLPAPTEEMKAGLKGLRLNDAELTAKANLANLRLDKLYGTREADARAQLNSQIDETISRLAKLAPEAPITLKLQGKSALYNNRTADAINFLNSAVGKLDSASERGDKYECMYLLAQAYRQGQQFGEAKRLLQDIVAPDHFPTFTPGRLMLAEMLFRESNVAEAKPHIEYLQKVLPNAPQVKKMAIALLVDQKAPKEEIAKQYNQLPESNRNERIDKYVIATLTQNFDDARRLLELVLKEDPGDAEAAVALSMLLDQKLNDKPAAQAVVDAAMKLKPTDPQLRVQQMRLRGASDEEIRKLTGEIIGDLQNPVDRQLAEMEFCRQKGDVDGMHKALAEAEKLGPDDPRVLEIRFNFALIEGNWDAASKAIEKLGSPNINADKVNGRLFRWRLAMAQNDLPKALEIANDLTRDQGAFAQSLVCKGQTQQAMRNYDGAMQSFTLARQKQPQNIEAHRGLIECAFALKRPNDAKKCIDDARKVLRGVPEFDLAADQWEINYGDPGPALTRREEALKKKPDAPEAYVSLGAGYLQAAKHKQDLKDDAAATALLTKARDLYQQAITKFPDNPEFTTNYASASLELKDFASAEKAWLALVNRDPFKGKVQAAQALADFYSKAGKFDQAEKVLTDYLKQHPEETKARYTLSNVYKLQGKFVQAADALGDSDDPRVRLSKIELMINAGKFEDAEKMLQPVVAANRASIEELNALGYVQVKQRKLREGVVTLDKVLAQDPQNSTAKLYRAEALLDMPQPNLDDLIRDLTTVRQAISGVGAQQANNLQARRLLAECYRRKGDFEAQFRELEDLVQAAPSDKPSRALLLNAYAGARPPRWGDGERIAGEIKQNPELAKDLDMLVAIAHFYARKGKAQNSHPAFQMALENIQQAVVQQPTNPRVLQVFLGYMIQAKAYRQLLDFTDQNLPPNIRQLWWVQHDRAIAKAKLGDKTGAAVDYNNALTTCLVAKDDASAQLVVQSMATELGLDVAWRHVEKQVSNGQPQWVMLGAVLKQRQGDIPAARKLVEQVLLSLDKLPVPQQATVLTYAGTLYMVDPNPDATRARNLYDRLAAIRPDDFAVWNNLACLPGISTEESLKYSQKAVDIMQRLGRPEPYVLDTHGWNLVQAGRLDEGIARLNEAYSAAESELFPDLLYHLGVAHLKKGNYDEAERCLTQAMQLFQKKLDDKAVTSMKLQDEIMTAQKELRDARQKSASGGS